MSIKNLLVTFLAFSFLLQIFFSVYYSSEIISQNNQYTNLSEKVKIQELQHQKLQTKLATETSLNKLYQFLKSKNYQPLWQQINLNQP